MIFISLARNIKRWDKYPKNIKINSNSYYGLDTKIKYFKTRLIEIISNIFIMLI